MNEVLCSHLYSLKLDMRYKLTDFILCIVTLL